MSASISRMVRHGLHSLTRKLTIEVLAASLPIVMLLAAPPPSLTKPVTSSPQSGGGQLSIEGVPMADATNANIKEFTERVALSYVASLQPVAASVAAAVVEPSGPTIPTSVPSLSRAAVAPRATKPGFRMVHIAAKVPPAPRPTLATVEPAVNAAPEEVKPRPPIQQAMIFATDAWRSVPNTGTFVAENIVSVGNALSSLAKKL
jgi:hypothetical protein